MLHRKGELAQARDAYRQGAWLEQSKEYGISDSYNLTNEILMRVLDESDRLDDHIPRVEAAVKTISTQVRGRRRDQWWAWADLGTLSAIMGDTDEAIRAYREFGRCGARSSDYKSALWMLVSLRDKLSAVQPERAEALDAVVHDLTYAQPLGQ